MPELFAALFGPKIERLAEAKDYEGLIKAAVHAKKAQVRQAAAQALRNLCSPEMAPTLIEALRSREMLPLHELAIELLGQAGSPLAARPLVEYVQSTSLHREAVFRALSRLGDAAIPAVETLFNNPDPYLRGQSLAALAAIRTPAALKSLAGTLDRPNLRTEAIQALLNMGAPGLEILSARLADLSQDQVEILLRGLHWMRAAGHPLIAGVLRSPNAALRKQAAALLQEGGWQPATDEERAWYAIGRGELMECVPLGAAAVEPLIAQLNDPVLQLPAIQALAEIGDQRAVLPLAAVLTSRLEKDMLPAQQRALRDTQQRLSIAFPQNTPPKVIQQLTSEKRSLEDGILQTTFLSVSGREAAAAALGKLADPAGVRALATALQTFGEDERVRLAAAEALAFIRDETACFALLEALPHGASEHLQVVILKSLACAAAILPLDSLADKLPWLYWAPLKTAAMLLEKSGWRPRGGEPEALYWLALGRRDQLIAGGEQTARILLPLCDTAKPGAAGEVIAMLPRLLPVVKDPELRRQMADKFIKTWIDHGLWTEIGGMGEDAVLPLCEFLNQASPDPDYGNTSRLQAAFGVLQALLKIDLQPRSLEAIAETVVILAFKRASVLCEPARKQAIDPAVPVIKPAVCHWRTSGDLELREFLIERVRLAGRTAFDPLLAGFQAAAQGNKVFALELMVKCDPERAKTLLPGWLEHPMAGVRSTAAHELAVLKVAGAIPAIRRLLQDPDVYTRATALQALEQLGEVHIEQYLKQLSSEKWSERKAAAQALVQLYREGRLDQEQKIQVLAQRDRITSRHTDEYNRAAHTDRSDQPGDIKSSDCHIDEAPHQDTGIGIDF